MKNGNDIIEIKNPKVEEIIRKSSGKRTGPLTWGDFRFGKWEIKLLAKGLIGRSRMEYHPYYRKLETAVREKMMQEMREHKEGHGESDSYAVHLFANMHAGDLKYRTAFGLCMILGTAEFWDIGCGQGMQAGLVAAWKGIRYVGIDCKTEQIRAYIHHSPEGEVTESTECSPFSVEEYNEIFTAYQGSISFRKAEYPCPVTPGKNSIAICLGLVFENPRRFGDALKKDFERVILQYPLNEEEEWKKALSPFCLHSLDVWYKTNYFTGKILGGWKVVLATVFPEDIEYLNRIGYDWNNIRFQLGNFHLTDYLDRFYENIEKE